MAKRGDADVAGVEHGTDEDIAESVDQPVADEVLAEKVTTNDEDEAVVRREMRRMREFVGGLQMEDLRQGTWFVQLLRFALDDYVTKVDAAYFREKYPNLPADAIAQARIAMAANYAAIEGGLSALACSGAALATVGSGGGASVLTLPAAGAAFVVDMSYTSYLQLRLAYDLAVLYRVPLDLKDPEDMWKFVRIAMGVKAGEAGSSAVTKGVPAVVRPVLKKVFSGATLKAAKSLPVVGKHLLQRNIVKFGVPGISVPITVAVNKWTTHVAGTSAAKTFRTEARLIEAAERLVASTPHHEDLAWVMWFVMHADGKIGENQRLLLHHVTRLAGDTAEDPGIFDALRDVIDVDEADILARVSVHDAADRAPLYRAARLTAIVDGDPHPTELARLTTIAATLGVDLETKAVKSEARGWR